jgi:hypothetical protein
MSSSNPCKNELNLSKSMLQAGKRIGPVKKRRFVEELLFFYFVSLLPRLSLPSSRLKKEK